MYQSMIAMLDKNNSCMSLGFLEGWEAAIAIRNSSARESGTIQKSIGLLSTRLFDWKYE